MTDISNENVYRSQEIGGYFGLDLPDFGDLYPEAIKFQSGRAAVRAVLECNDIAHVYMPAYICDSIIQAAKDTGLDIDLYSLDESMYPKGIPAQLSHDSVVLYVNYFGICQSNVTCLENTIPVEQLIIDNSHSLFSPHTNVLASIYSPRKFAGLPDGGLLKHSPLLNISPPEEEDSKSFDRIEYLLTRTAYSARDGYAGFNEARISLKDNRPLQMSRLTQRLIKSISWDDIADKRKNNYGLLHSLLVGANDFNLVANENDIPLCYPFTIKGHFMGEARRKLADKGIFIAVYWPDAIARIQPDSIEHILINETLFLPIDQRMDAQQVRLVASLVMDLVGA